MGFIDQPGTGGGGDSHTISSADTLTNKTIDADNNTLSNIGLAEVDTDTSDMLDVLIGSTLDDTSVSVSSNGTTITLSLEKSGGGDVRFLFSDGVHTHDCTPAATVSLTAGTDASPQLNYVYILQSTKALTVSTSAWPTDAEHAHIATVVCQSAASAQTDGVYKLHVWTDHTQATTGNVQGHIAHLNEWIRYQPATYVSGAALTPTVGVGTFDIATSAGVVLQLHDHAFPAFDTSTGSSVFVVNDPDAAYTKLGDLTIAGGLDKDANGTTLGAATTDFYNLVIWGVASQDGTDAKLMVNVPNGAYPNNNANQAIDDTDQTAVYTIPDAYTGTGFLIARLTVSVSGTTYTIEQNEDLRGQFPTTTAGGVGATTSKFADNAFRIQDDGDTTKEIAFQASAITTATTRTITMPDQDIDLTPDTGTYQAVLAEGAFADGDKTNLDKAVLADGTGNDITGDLVFTEKADHSSTPSAGKGYLWVKNDTPSSLIYTDDAGTDTDLTAAGGGGQTLYDAILDAGGGGDYTDWSTAMAALTSGQTLFVRSGTYTETTAIAFSTTNVTIIGENPETTILKLNSTSNSAWSGADMVIKNIGLENANSGRWQLSGADTVIDGCRIFITGSAALLCFQITGARTCIINSQITDTSAAAARKIDMAATGCLFSNNRCIISNNSNNTSQGWLRMNNEYTTVSNCDFDVATSGTSSAPVVSSNGTVIGCTVDGGTASNALGIFGDNTSKIIGNFVKTVLIGISVGSDSVCTGNRILANNGATARGIKLRSHRTVCTGNFMQGITTAGAIGVEIANGIDSCAVTGNVIYNYDTGVDIAGSAADNNVIVGNSFANCTTDIDDNGTATVKDIDMTVTAGTEPLNST